MVPRRGPLVVLAPSRIELDPTDVEIVPAFLVGVILGPVAAKFLDPDKWGSATPGQEPAITLGVMRVMIGTQL